ncbi:hypothetical protein BDQ17DRAFT_1373150 [Cyathus striatus]|nr:hypothetical protein BDQ17DRAFT_1373150 [Cyathus striatus]
MRFMRIVGYAAAGCLGTGDFFFVHGLDYGAMGYGDGHGHSRGRGGRYTVHCSGGRVLGRGKGTGACVLQARMYIVAVMLVVACAGATYGSLCGSYCFDLKDRSNVVSMFEGACL